MPRIFCDDLEVGSAFWGDWVTVDPDEMLDYARRNDPQPFHVDAEAARATPFGGLIASASYTGRWTRRVRRPQRSSSRGSGSPRSIPMPSPPWRSGTASARLRR